MEFRIDELLDDLEVQEIALPAVEYTSRTESRS